VEDDSAVREKKIIAILNEEIEDGQNLASEARKKVEYLLLEKKGYSRDEVRKNVVFEVVLEKERFSSSVDFLVTVGGKKAMIIKCAAGSLSSRERHAVAAARLLAIPPVPMAVVTDPATAEVLDTETGNVIGEGFGSIPVRAEMAALLSEKESKPLTPERIDKEKRILLAFDAIKCCVPQGSDGGVQIGPEPGKDDTCQC
jgi:hypothetical protein